MIRISWGGTSLSLAAIGLVLLYPTWGLSGYLIYPGCLFALVALFREPQRLPTRLALCGSAIAVVLWFAFAWNWF